MANESPATVIKQLENQIQMILRKVKFDELSEKASKASESLRQNLTDAKLYARHYELSEMRDEQLDNAKQAKKWLEQARQSLLRASEFDVFVPIDVAHISAKIDQVKDGLN